MLELVNQFENGGDLSQIKGIAYKDKDTGQVIADFSAGFGGRLDSLPPPSRGLFDNCSYKKYYLEGVA